MKEDEMSEACSTHGSDDKRIQNLDQINQKGEISERPKCSLESSIETGI